MEEIENVRKDNYQKLPGMVVNYVFAPFTDISGRLLGDMGIEEYRKRRRWDELWQIIEMEDYKLVISHRV